MPSGNNLYFDVDSIKFDRAMSALVEAFEGSKVGSQIVREETRLLLEQLIRFTPSKTLKQGRAAVQRDITRAMNPLDDTIFKSKKIADFIKKNDINAVRDIVRRIPKMSHYKVEDFDPQRLHQDKRDRRGRIQRDKFVFVLGKRKWKKYVSEKQKKVGSAKAGYYPALSAVGGAAANWISRHGNRYGSVDDNLGDRRHPRVRIANRAAGAMTAAAESHVLNSAIRMRAKSMESKARRHILEKAKAAGLHTH